MSSWAPSRLPQIRDGLQRYLVDSRGLLQSDLAAGDAQIATEAAELAAGLGEGLRSADLYWVSSPMAALAVGAAEDLSQVRWAAPECPAAHGLVVFDEGIGTIAHDGWPLPVDAVAWTARPGSLLFGFFFRRARADRYLADEGRQVDTSRLPALIPCGITEVEVHEDWRPAKDLHPAERTVLTTVATTWMLMQQPGIVEHAPIEPDRKIARAYQRAGKPHPGVTLVELRRQYQPKLGPTEEDVPGRHYRHRWIVRGHWRQQAYGPQRSLRRPTWVPSHIKGPDGADLLETTIVNVWRH